MREKYLRGRITVVHREAFGVDKCLGFYLKEVKEPFFRPLRNILHVLYHLRLPTEALASVKKQYVGTKNIAICSKSHHVALEPHSVLNILFAKHIFRGAGLTLRTPSAVRGVGQHQFHVLRQSRTRPQVMHVFQLNEKRILD